MEHNIVAVLGPTYESGPAAVVIDLGQQGVGIAYDTHGLFEGVTPEPERKPKRKRKEAA